MIRLDGGGGCRKNDKRGHPEPWKGGTCPALETTATCLPSSPKLPNQPHSVLTAWFLWAFLSMPVRSTLSQTLTAQQPELLYKDYWKITTLDFFLNLKKKFVVPFIFYKGNKKHQYYVHDLLTNSYLGFNCLKSSERILMSVYVLSPWFLASKVMTDTKVWFTVWFVALQIWLQYLPKGHLN